MSDITFVRQDFERAFKTAIDRALVFEGGDRQVEYLGELVVTSIFQTSSDPATVAEYYQKHIESVSFSVQLLDILHSFLSEFTFCLLLRNDPKLQDMVLEFVASAVTVNVGLGSNLLPDHVFDALSKKEEALAVLRSNPWYYALVLIGLFGTGLLTEAAPLKGERARRPKEE